MLQYLLSLCDGLDLVRSVSTPCPHPPVITWEYTLPPVGDGCGAGYSDGQLKSHVMEMALGENKLIDLTFSKIKSDENLLISQYGEIHSPSSKRYYFKMQRVIV